MTTKDEAIELAAGSVRMSVSDVRVVVNAYEAARSAVNRAAKARPKRKPKPKPTAAAKTATYKGGGYYELSSGKVVKGKAAIPRGYTVNG